MKNILTLSLVAVATLFVSAVGAQDVETQKTPVAKLTKSISGDCTGEACASSSCCKGCPVTAAMAKLPKMSYRVGTENICCSESAAKMAAEKKTPLHFVVGEKVFEDKTEAYTSLVEQTESMVTKFITPSACAKSGTHTVAGKSCKCEAQAGKNAELVSTAVKNVKMTYVVGEKSCECSHEAGALAKKSGEKMTYVVGEEKTCCNMTARLALAKAKYKAAVSAMVATEKAAEKTETSATEKVGS